MANLEISWAISSRFEGAWTTYERAYKIDNGNYFPFGRRLKANYVGTNYGFTAAFAYDYVQGWQRLTPAQMFDKMRSLSEYDVKNIFGSLKWNWCNGDKIQNQSIANLLFDFTVMADQAAVKAVAAALNRPLSQMSSVRKITTRKTTDGYRVLNDIATSFINNHDNPQLFFNRVKSSYMSYHIKKNSPTSIKNRVNSFEYFEANEFMLL